jgi:hypothetical protein
MPMTVMLTCLPSHGVPDAVHCEKRRCERWCACTRTHDGIDQADGALIAGQDGIALEDAWFGGVP